MLALTDEMPFDDVNWGSLKLKKDEKDAIDEKSASDDDNDPMFAPSAPDPKRSLQKPSMSC